MAMVCPVWDLPTPHNPPQPRSHMCRSGINFPNQERTLELGGIRCKTLLPFDHGFRVVTAADGGNANNPPPSLPRDYLTMDQVIQVRRPIVGRGARLGLK